MKRKRTTPAADNTPPADTDGRLTPEPPATLHFTPLTLSSKLVLHRVHQGMYRGDQFSPGLKGNARFSPVRNAEDDPIPTIYAASTFEAAAMESLFHDVSLMHQASSSTTSASSKGRSIPRSRSRRT